MKGEWDNTCSYVKIQQMLHSGKFEAVLKIDEEILDYEILNLLLQPLIENAIIHGLDHKVTDGSKKLEVLGKSTQQGLIFIVYDNGCGMTEETRQKMLTMKSRDTGCKMFIIEFSYIMEINMDFNMKVRLMWEQKLHLPSQRWKVQKSKMFKDKNCLYGPFF